MIHYNDLKQSDKNGIHEVLFQMNIIGIGDDDKVEHYYNQLPESIKEDGQHYSFSDTVIQDLIHDWFEKNILSIILI